MGKGKLFKWIAPICIGAIVVGAGIASPNISVSAVSSYSTPAITIQARNKVTLNNSKLSTKIRSMLGLSNTETLYSDAFLTNQNYSAEAESPIYQLDFSNTGITDIRELLQFELPSQIKGINLAGNGITLNDLANITAVLNCKVGDTIVLGEGTITSATDFSSQIMKVNLNDNQIDLSQTNATYLNNTKLLFGLQNFGEIDSSGFVMTGELNPKYYIRSNSDENYLSFTFIHALSTEVDSKIRIIRDTVVSLVDPSLNDKYTIKVASVPNSSTAYFSGYTFEREFTQFSLSIDEDFKVERKNLLDLRITSDGKLLNDSPINIDGFGNNASLSISYNNASTSRITTENYKNYVNITLTKDGKSRTIPLEFKIVDTIKPVIKLIGSSHAYSSKNKQYNDPGVIAYDPSVAGAESGDDLSSMVVIDNKVDVTTLGQYTITYSVTDSGDNTTSITRIVDIQEQVLDTIVLRSNTTDLVDGGDIVLIVQPDTGVPINKYKDITYYWYLNGVLFQTTKGDSVTGKSTITIIADASADQEIYVRLTATQISDNAKIELFSDVLDLNIEPNITGDNTVIIAVGIVVLLILAVVIIWMIIKYRKSKEKTHGKHKNFHKGKAQKDKKPVDKGPEIQVYKDYTGTPNNTGTGTGSQGGGEGGGNSNFRPAEPNDKDNMNK